MNISQQSTPQTRCSERQMALIYGLIAAVSCLGYSIILKVTIRKKLNRKPRYFIISMLSLTDASFALTVSLATIVGNFLQRSYTCQILTEGGQFIGNVTFHLSCMLSLAYCLNQFIAIRYGLRYDAIVTKGRIKTLVLILVLLITFLNTITTVMGKAYIIVLNSKMKYWRMVVNAVISLSSVLIMSVNLAHGNCISRQQMRRLTTHERSSLFWVGRKRVRREVTILTVAVVIVLTPTAAFYTKILFVHSHFDDDLLKITRGFLLLFCCLNPYLYMSTLQDIREEVRSFVRKYSCSCRKRTENHAVQRDRRQFSCESVLTIIDHSSNHTSSVHVTHDSTEEEEIGDVEVVQNVYNIGVEKEDSALDTIKVDQVKRKYEVTKKYVNSLITRKIIEDLYLAGAIPDKMSYGTFFDINTET